MISQTHAAKSEALRRMCGLGGNAVMQRMPGEGIMRRASAGVFSTGSRGQVTSDAPAGLGNWDNSCYQNSVLQGLASLDSLKGYLRQSENGAESNTTATLLETINKLNDAANNGKLLWTPAKLKSMSSWQQQDAQEYFSKIMDELDKEAAKSLSTSQSKPGLESLTASSTSTTTTTTPDIPTKPEEAGATTADRHNPLDGLLAQSVICTRCSFSEGLSLIPFNCLTLPLGPNFAYDLEECLDEYTKREEISEVECAKCTLLRAQGQLEEMLPPPPSFQNVDEAVAAPPVKAEEKAIMPLPPELRAQAFRRLGAIQQALQGDDFADKTLNEVCQIPKKARVASTKTRQAVIGRAPRSLVVHVNRSVFDEVAGVQRKNYAAVRYPAVLDLGGWMLSSEGEGAEGRGMLGPESGLGDACGGGGGRGGGKYRLKAVVTHYGRHENGHYICYRQHPVLAKMDSELDGIDDDAQEQDEGLREEKTELRWWRLSDEDVSPVSEEDVLQQGGVFMLFYEREVEPERTEPAASSSVDARETATQSTADSELLQRPEDIKAQEEIVITDSPDATDTNANIDSSVPPEEPAAATPSSTAEASASYPSSPLDAPSTEATTEDELEAEERLAPADTVQKPSSPTLMRTARGAPPSPREKRFASAFRPVAAT